MFSGEPSSLPGQHGPIDVITPATAAGLTLQQGWMRFKDLTFRGAATQPQSHHTDIATFAGGKPMAWLARQQCNETALLIIKLKRAVGGVDTAALITMAIEPCTAPATAPAAQQSIRQGLVSSRGVTHGQRLRRPTAKSKWIAGMPWRRLHSP